MNLKWEVSKQMLGSIIRYFIIAAGSWLVGHDIVPKDLFDSWVSEFTSVVVGVLILAAAVAWRYLNARFNLLALIKAVQTDPPADDPIEIAAAVHNAKKEASESPILTASA